MISKHWTLGRLHTFLGTSDRVGIEVMLDWYQASLAVQLLNVWVVFEWWPNESAS